MNLLLIILFQMQFGAIQADSTEAVRWDWFKQDSIFISSWTNTALKNPQQIVKHFPLPRKPFHLDTLGFGYTYYESSVGKGYVTCFYSLVLYKGKLISYELWPEMPDNHKLDSLYVKLYSPIFEFTSDGKAKPFRWNNHFAQTPISDKRFLLKVSEQSDPDIKELMTPFVGIEYGYYGGEASSMLSSRKAFQKVKNKLNDSTIVAILHSINPATRMMAIEYLERNHYNVSIPIESLKHDIAVIYKECPRVLSFFGCIKDTDDAKRLMREFVKNKKLN